MPLAANNGKQGCVAHDVSVFLAPGLHFDPHADPQRVRGLIAMLPDKAAKAPAPNDAQVAATTDGETP